MFALAINVMILTMVNLDGGIFRIVTLTVYILTQRPEIQHLRDFCARTAQGRNTKIDPLGSDTANLSVHMKNFADAK